MNEKLFDRTDFFLTGKVKSLDSLPAGVKIAKCRYGDAMVTASKLVCYWICSDSCWGSPMDVICDYCGKANGATRAMVRAKAQSAIEQIEIKKGSETFMVGNRLYTVYKGDFANIKQFAVDCLLEICNALQGVAVSDVKFIKSLYTNGCARLITAVSKIGWTVSDVLGLFGLAVPDLRGSATCAGEPFVIINEQAAITFSGTTGAPFVIATNDFVESIRCSKYNQILAE